MRRSLCVILFGAFLLAACGGNTPAPTVDSSSAPTVEATAAAADASNVTETAPLPTIEQQQREFETSEAPLPIPGTLDASTNPDPEAGLVFDDIQLERTGGIAGQTLSIVLNGDGTFTRDGVAGTISPDQVIMIDNMLDEMNFFGLQGVFTAPGTGADIYTYAVRVSRAGSARTIRAQDGLIPPELIELLSVLSDLGVPTAP